MSIFTKIWSWLKTAFTHITTDLDKVAISVTQQIKKAADSGELQFVANIIDGLTHSGVASEIAGTIKNSIVKVLSFELALQLPENFSGDDLIAWEQRVMDAIGVHKDKSAIWTKVSATVIRDVQAFTQDGTSVSFAEAVKLAEDAYQTYKDALNEDIT
jgi:hypothetical protein